jgi:hypothetical protein
MPERERSLCSMWFHAFARSRRWINARPRLRTLGAAIVVIAVLLTPFGLDVEHHTAALERC